MQLLLPRIIIMLMGAVRLGVPPYELQLHLKF